MPPALAIRCAGPADSGVVADVLARAFEPLRPHYTPAAFAATTPGADVLRGRLAEGPTWLALLDGAAVGTVSALPRGPDLYVRSMAVLPAARGLGLGRRLLAEVEAYARAQGHQRLTLSSTPFLDDALALYASAGFLPMDEGPSDLHGTPLVGMAKNLREEGE